jgi:hypothetical protein
VGLPLFEGGIVKPIELVNKDAEDKKVLAYACGECGVVCGSAAHSKEAAKAHCLPNICECGLQCAQYRTVCVICNVKKQREKQVARAASANEVSQWVGPVFVEDAEGHPVGGPHCGEGYYTDVDEAIELLADDVDWPIPSTLFVWGSRRILFHLDAGGIIENALEEHYEDADVSSAAGEELQEFLNGWCERNDIESHEPDFKVLVSGVLREIEKVRNEE